MSLENRPTVVVIGAGVIGLTSAVSIQRYIAQQKLPHGVLLVAREFPSGLLSVPSANYASMWAGGHVRPIPADTPQLKQEAAWLKTTGGIFEEISSKEPWMGITPLKGVEYLARPTEAYRNLFSDARNFEAESGLKGFRLLGDEELPQGMGFGIEYDTYCINTPMYCMGLLRKFLLNGGRTMEKSLVSEWEAFSLKKDVRLVVNASGMGFKDPASFPIRGQLCLVSNPADKTITQQNADGTWTFIIPRGFDGGTVVGGTKEPNNWSLEASTENRKRILESASKMYPKILNEHGELELVTDVVARRPAREGGMRIEIESNPDNLEKQQRVVHAYGAAGRGYEISWGVAKDVTALVESILNSQVKAKL